MAEAGLLIPPSLAATAQEIRSTRDTPTDILSPGGGAASPFYTTSPDQSKTRSTNHRLSNGQHLDPRARVN